MDERNVEDEILVFLSVNTVPPYDYVRAFLQFSKKSRKRYHERDACDVKANITVYTESKKNVKNTVKGNNIISQLMYERSKMYQAPSNHQLKTYLD